MTANTTSGGLSHSINFHFEYALEAKRYEHEGEDYIGIGVLARMVDMYGNEIIERVRDITSELELAQRLIHQLAMAKVSPMCLRLFVEDFLARN